MATITTKRIYAPPQPSDGFRLLVMRRWPRGIAKNAVDAWEKELGSSPALLQWWRAGEVGWEEFTQEYRAQLHRQPTLLAWASGLAQRQPLTLLCSCQDPERCHRTLLKGLLEEMAQQERFPPEPSSRSTRRAPA
jgi:uncharacterized protein YeaO (DUF488 family)